MIYAAKITDGLVDQVTVEADDYSAPDGWVIVGPINAVAVGWAYDGTRFIPPEPEPDAQEAQ